MTLKELKNFINNLPSEMGGFEIVNGQIGVIDQTGNNDKTVYRVDDPIIAIYVDEKEMQLCLFYQSQEDITNVLKTNISGTTKGV